MSISCLHLGVLPHKNINAVVDIISKYFSDVPFWAQLPNYSSVEGNFLQFLTPIPGVKNDILKKKYYLDTKSYIYETRSSGIVKDFEDLSFNKLKKYRPNSVFFDYFLRVIDEYKPQYAKGQIVGPITLGLLLADESGTPVIENMKAMDLLIKSSCMQIISQICEMKSVYPVIKPFIFVDEAELGRAVISDNAFRSRRKILAILKTLVKTIKDNGGIPAISASSCLDWSIPLEAGFEIISINPDSQFVTLLNKNLKLDKYFNLGKKIAWNILPNRLDAIKNTDVHSLFLKYLDYVVRLKNFHKLHRSLILNNSIVTVIASPQSIAFWLLPHASIQRQWPALQGADPIQAHR